ncbi:MAG TPA: ADP-L-glycero-D-manno-heptose-6-epimerase [Oceanospirillaceae bacterium]|jgi:UDP-glucose 4-epimerase|nr:ADP-L-glycero-D-manno-heptose-6-epimerase [Oceanospirillaceae bacterium]
MQLKKVLVTGGAGFIGSNLCERLQQEGCYEVVSLDNYFTGSKANHVLGVEYIEGSAADVDKLVNFVPDYIYHLGEYSRVEQSFDDIELVWKYNKESTFRLLQFCRKHKSKLIYAGSSTKFGDGGLGRSQSPYGWSKSANTELVENFGQWFGLEYAIVYFYNVYGKREISTGRYATLIALFAEKMRNQQNLTVVSPGLQLRNFTHVDDIVDGLVLVGEKGSGDKYGIGCSDGYSVLDVANLFGGKIEMLPERRGNRMTADVITEKTEALGWQAKRWLADYIETLRANNWQLPN